MKFYGLCGKLAVAILASATGWQAAAETRLDFDAGVWVPFLPDYTAASIVQTPFPNNTVQRDLFADDQSDIGTSLGLSGLVDLGGTGRMLEFDLDLAGVSSMGGSGVYADPGAGQSVWLSSLDGVGFVSTPDGGSVAVSLGSEVFYASQYVGLADRYCTRLPGLGELELGIGFRHMRYEQQHALNGAFSTGISAQYFEGVDTTYLGGEVRGSLRRTLRGHDLVLDFGVGLFDMDGDYEGISTLRDGVGAVFDQDNIALGASDFAVTVDLALWWDAVLGGVSVRPGVSLQYLSDMPSINHPMTEFVSGGAPVSIGTSPGYFLGVNVEVLLGSR